MRTRTTIQSVLVPAGRSASVVVMVGLLLVVQVLAQQSSYETFTDRQRRFAVDYPRDWMWEVIAASGEPMFLARQPKRQAAVSVERIRLKRALAGDEINDAFAQVEVDLLRENQPLATDVKASVVSIASGRRFLVINYLRPGGTPTQHVRQYSYPADKDLYRITCMAPDADSFRKYESVCDTMVQSLKSARELGPAPDASQSR